MPRLLLALPLVLILAPSAPAAAEGPSPVERAVARARDEVAREVRYDSTYRELTWKGGRDTGARVYPGGDLDPGRGVCTDLVVRALRAGGLDLQARLHEDVLARRAAYARFVKVPDANIDHRRAGPMMVFLEAHAERLPADADFRPGDVVVWTFGAPGVGTPQHVGLVGDRRGPAGEPWVLHNLGPRPTEEDALHRWPILGHYRVLASIRIQE